MQSFNPIEDLFKGRHFDRQIIILCVSWYTSFKLSLRDLVIMMADRGIGVTHTTIPSSRLRLLPKRSNRLRRACDTAVRYQWHSSAVANCRILDRSVSCPHEVHSLQIDHSVEKMSGLHRRESRHLFWRSSPYEKTPLSIRQADMFVGMQKSNASATVSNTGRSYQWIF
jgi:hypothetical protein